MLALTDVQHMVIVLCYIVAAGWAFGLCCIAFLAIREDIRHYREVKSDKTHDDFVLGIINDLEIFETTIINGKKAWRLKEKSDDRGTK